MSIFSKVRQNLPVGLILIGFLIAVIASTYHLSESPGIWYDEGFYTQTAMNLARYGYEGLQIAPGQFTSAADITVGYPLIYPVSFVYRFFGAGVLQGRVVMVCFILAFVLFSYVLIRKLFGALTALWALFLIASFPLLYGNGKSVLGEVPGIVFVVFALLALLWLERSQYQNLYAYAGLGLAAGLAAATKPIFLLALGALGMMFIVLFVRRAPLRVSGITIAILAVILSLVVWFLTQFGMGDTLSGVLALYANPYEVTNFATLVQQNLLRFITESTPIYMLVILVVWTASYAIRRRAQETVSVVEEAALLFSGLILLAYLRLDGWYRYFFPAMTLGLLFLQPSVSRVMLFVQNRFGLPRLSYVVSGVFALLIVGQLYQVAFTSYVAQYYMGHRTRDVSAALAALPVDSNVFLYDVPEVAILLPAEGNYYQYIAPHPNQLIGVEELSVLTKRIPRYVIAGGNMVLDPTRFAGYHVIAIVNRYAIFERS